MLDLRWSWQFHLLKNCVEWLIESMESRSKDEKIRFTFVKLLRLNYSRCFILNLFNILCLVFLTFQISIKVPESWCLETIPQVSSHHSAVPTLFLTRKFYGQYFFVDLIYISFSGIYLTSKYQSKQLVNASLSKSL